MQNTYVHSTSENSLISVIRICNKEYKILIKNVNVIFIVLAMVIAKLNNYHYDVSHSIPYETIFCIFNTWKNYRVCTYKLRILYRHIYINCLRN